MEKRYPRKFLWRSIKLRPQKLQKETDQTEAIVYINELQTKKSLVVPGTQKPCDSNKGVSCDET